MLADTAMGTERPVRARRRAAGFTYLTLLFMIAFAGIALAAVGVLWSIETKREKEADLLFAGTQTAQAIAQYRKDHQDDKKKIDGYPRELAWLIQDPSTPVARRYLRRIYIDPMTASQNWGLILLPGGGIVGIYSRSSQRPLKVANFPGEIQLPAKVISYADWRFIAPSSPVPAIPTQTQSDGAVPTDAPPIISIPPPQPGSLAATARERPDTCTRGNQNDVQVCQSIQLRIGSAEAAECLASAAERLDACRGGTSMPPLRRNF